MNQKFNLLFPHDELARKFYIFDLIFSVSGGLTVILLYLVAIGFAKRRFKRLRAPSTHMNSTFNSSSSTCQQSESKTSRAEAAKRKSSALYKWGVYELCYFSIVVRFFISYIYDFQSKSYNIVQYANIECLKTRQKYAITGNVIILLAENRFYSYCQLFYNASFVTF